MLINCQSPPRTSSSLSETLHLLCQSSRSVFESSSRTHQWFLAVTLYHAIVALRSCSNSSAPLDMQRTNLDGPNLCSQIYGRDWILEAPCHSTFKRRGGVWNWARISRATRIRVPRSMTLKRFWTLLAFLPLIQRGPEWWGIDERPHP
jgi:hypothetical protein